VADRIKALLAEFVDLVMRRVDYHALYAGTVVSQSGALVDVKCDSSKMPQLRGVKVRHGLPGASSTVPQGTRVLVGFEDGSPSKPYVAMFENLQATRVAIDALDVRLGSADAARAVAAVGDVVSMSGTIILPGPTPTLATFDGMIVAVGGTRVKIT
jgi:hypothetical protein